MNMPRKVAGNGSAIFVPVQILRCVAAPLVLAACLVLCAPRASCAQAGEIDALATKLGKALSDSHAKSVVVFDFAGPGKKVTRLGQSLADQVSAVLASVGTEYSIIGRNVLQSAIENEHLAPIDDWNSQSLKMGRWIASEAGASELVIGFIENDPEGVRLRVDSYEVGSEERIAGYGVIMPITSDLQKSLDTKLVIPSTAIPLAGTNGYSVPKCDSCPVPRFTQESIRLQKSGTVVLAVVITAEGKTTDFRLVKDPGYGMAQQAIDAVSKWRLIPAAGPDGKAAPVWTFVEVNFKLLNGHR